MFVPFEDISQESRVWVYQSDRKIQSGDITGMENSLRLFLEKWTAHGNELKASAAILHQYFLVVALDELQAGASGCSIDASVHFIKSMSLDSGYDFFERNLVAIEENGEIKLLPLNEVKENIKNGILEADTRTYNNLIQQKKDLRINWRIRIGDSWLKRYLAEDVSSKVPQDRSEV